MTGERLRVESSEIAEVRAAAAWLELLCQVFKACSKSKQPVALDKRATGCLLLEHTQRFVAGIAECYCTNGLGVVWSAPGRNTDSSMSVGCR